MTEIEIKFYALETSPQVFHDPALRSTFINIAGESIGSMGPLTITGVRLNGVDQWFRHVNETTVMVVPKLPLEGGTLVVRCISPVKAAKPLMQSRPYSPMPDNAYGLQRPSAAWKVVG